MYRPLDSIAEGEEDDPVPGVVDSSEGEVEPKPSLESDTDDVEDSGDEGSAAHYKCCAKDTAQIS